MAFDLHTQLRPAAAPNPPPASGAAVAGGAVGWAVACVLVALAGCQPPTLKPNAGTVTKADAGGADTAGTVAQDTAAAKPDAGVDADAAAAAEVAGECSGDAECAAKAKPCQKGLCLQNKCFFDTLPDSAACSDGNPCTSGEACTGGACGGGKPTPCDDNNGCTADSCDPAKGCVHSEQAGGPCNDGKFCTVNDHCAAGKCVGDANLACDCTAVDAPCDTTDVCDGPRKCDKNFKCVATGGGLKCPDDTPGDCVVAYCDAKAGKCATKIAADKSACNDGIDCTKEDACKDGKCVFATNTCECIVNDDCEKLPQYAQGGDLCKPKYYCDKSDDSVTKKTIYKCKILPSSLIYCDPAADTQCMKNTCNSATGKCGLKNLNPIGSFNGCDDGLKATDGDYCDDDGICKGSAWTASCSSNKDCEKEEDGDVCNGTLFCNKAIQKCQLNPATIVKCPTALDTQCSITLCNKKSGKCEVTPIEKLGKSCPADKPDCKTYIPLADEKTITVACDDGDLCTASSSCRNGSCVAEPTSYVCSCTADADCIAKDDGDKCNGTLYCNKAAGKCELNPATIVTCSSTYDTQCAKNVCDPATGKCKLTEVGKPGNYTPCEDGNLCTSGDDCEGGACVPGTNLCKCTKDADCDNDNDPCNGVEYCNKAVGKCETNPATIVTCPTTFDTTCSKNTCDKTSGKCAMVAVSDLLKCSDDNPCTVGDVCVKGTCTAGTNTCSCTKNEDCASKEDGDLCNGTLYCDTSAAPFACKVNPASIPYCPTGQDTDCIKNQCDKATGKCSPQPVAQFFAPCSDNNPCTVGDSCLKGACLSGANLCSCLTKDDCGNKGDFNACTGTLDCLQVGDKKICAINPSTVLSCPAGTECTKGACDPASGKCTSVSGPEFCDDGNPCTAESCVSAKCVNTKLVDGTSCGTGKVCTAGICGAK